MSLIFDYGAVSRALDNLRQPGRRRLEPEPDDMPTVETRPCTRQCGQKVHGVERQCDGSCVPWP
jgi:hypothetical protein